ncbi:MAG: PAS domain S-box protein [Nitrospira sp.]|nr:PAS domain S-box protein [Nitrospira sp.]
MAKFVQLRRELDVVLGDEIQVLSHAGLSKAKEDALNAASRANAYNAIAKLLTLVIGILGGVLITRGITRPVHQLVEATEIIGKDDFSQRIKVKTRDEIAHLSESFNQMIVELQKTTVARDYVENILNLMGESLIVVSRDGKIEKLNPAACNLLGYTEDELIGQSYQKILIDEDINIDIPFKGSILGADSVYLSKNNESIPVLLTVSVMKDKNGLITGYIFIAEDITERKQAKEALKESEARFRTLISNAPFSIWSCNSDGTITYANKAALDLFGITDLTQIIGRYNIFNSSIDAEKRLLGYFERAYNGEVVYYEQELYKAS